MNFLALCLTTLASFGALFLVAKFIGHKQIAQLDFFDYITGITIGSIAAEMATELEEPWKPFTAMVINEMRKDAIAKSAVPKPYGKKEKNIS